MIDSEGQVVPVNSPGEVCFRGYNIMAGYWDDEEKTNSVIERSGWFHSGWVDTRIVHSGWVDTRIIHSGWVDIRVVHSESVNTEIVHGGWVDTEIGHSEFTRIVTVGG